MLAVAGGALAFSALKTGATDIQVAADGGDDGAQPEGGAVVTSTTLPTSTTPTTAPAVEPLDMPTDAVPDSLGGYVLANDGALRHVHFDGTARPIALAVPPGGFVQLWVTDVAELDGIPYLFIDEFVNRRDLAAEKTAALYEKYGLTYGADADPWSELDGVATQEELDALEHWEVSILAVDLRTDMVTVVEKRIIGSAVSNEWIYNGHITTDGSRILVMRELWQSACLYVEALTFDGAVLELTENPSPAPEGLGTFDYETIRSMQRGEVPLPQPCATLAEIDDDGRELLGAQVDQARIDAVNSGLP